MAMYIISEKIEHSTSTMWICPIRVLNKTRKMNLLICIIFCLAPLVLEYNTDQFHNIGMFWYPFIENFANCLKSQH